MCKSKPACVQQLTALLLSRHIHIDLQSKLGFLHQGFCVVIHAKGLKNNQFTRIILGRIFTASVHFQAQARSRFICMEGLGLLHVLSVVVIH